MHQFLTNLETKFEEKLFLQGETIFENTSNPVIQKEKKGLFIVNFTLDKKAFEVEIQKKPAGKIVSTCVCSDHAKNGVCGHIIATLFILREDEVNQKQLKKLAKPKEYKPRQVESKNILDFINEKELKVFLKSYARRNPNFKIELNAHFASKVDFNNNELKYKEVLNNLIKAKTNSNPKLSRSQILTFQKILKDLLSQANDMYSLERYDEVFYACKYCLDKLFYVKNIFKVEKDFLDEYLFSFTDLIDKLLTRELAPEFRTKIERDLIELVQLSYCLPHNNLSILDIVFEGKFASKEDFDEILDNLRNKIKRLDDYPGSQVLSKIICSGLDNTIKSTFILEHYSISKITKALNVKDEKSNIVNYIKFVDQVIKLHPEVHELKFLRLRDLIRAEKYDLALKHFKKGLKNNEKIEKILPILSLIPNELMEVSTKDFFKALEPYPAELRCKFFSQYDDYKSVFEIIKELNDMNLMMHYDNHFIEDQIEDVELFYNQWSVKYLDEHIGVQSHDKILTLKHHLNQLGAKDVAKRLTENLTEAFKHRKNMKLLS